MQYSDTTNKSGLLQRCEILCGFADGGISGSATLKAQFTGLLNSAYQKVVTMVLDSKDEWDWDDINWTDYAVLTTPLTTNRDYSISASEAVLKIKRVDVSYDGTNFYKAEPFDINESGLGFGTASDTTQEATVDGRFSKNAPKYDTRANTVWLYPKPSAADVSAGGKIRIEWIREPDEFTTSDTTQEPGIDEAFHPMLALDASYVYTFAQDLKRANAIKNEMIEYEARLKKHYSSKQEDRKLVLRDAGTSYR